MSTKKTTNLLLCLILAAGASGAASAQDGAALYVEKTCATCHGADGKTPILPVYPKIAGQNKDYLLTQLKDIKSGTRKNAMTPAMQGIMQNVSEEEMSILADWIAGLSCN
jgi:cytochrome c